MQLTERTRDVYEPISAYPKPPLIPLPEPGNFKFLQKLGIKPCAFSRAIVKTSMFLSGFTSFQKKLPDNIETLLRKTNSRGSVLSTPIMSATLALKDDPLISDPIERAVALLLAARSLYQDIKTGSLEPDRYRDQVLEMGQYPNLFSTCLIVDGKKSRIYKSTNTSFITLILNGRFFIWEIWPNDSSPSASQLQEILAKFIQQEIKAKNEPLREPSPGELTFAPHKPQLQFFKKLLRDKINKESLFTIRHSFFTLCLDLNDSPASYAEAALIAHSRNRENRWNHSSMQLVVFGNARACIICNFSTYLDGNVMMRAGAEIQKRAAALKLENGRPSSAISPPRPLSWRIPNEFIERARKGVNRMLDDQQATFEIRGIGRRFFNEHGLDAISVFILALLMTTKELAGRYAQITQFLTMSKYRFMDLMTANVTTPQGIQFATYMAQDKIDRDRALALLRQAVDSQKEIVRKERKCLPLSKVILLYLLSRKGLIRLYVASMRALTAFILLVTGMLKVQQREVLVSHPQIYPEVPIVGRPGIRLPYVKYFGLHYQILDDRIVVTLMPSVKWQVPNSKLMETLEKNLRRIEGIVKVRELHTV